jgi:3-deoxy-D-manno-octulosonic-acid transferase
MWMNIYKTVMQNSTPVLEAYLARRMRRGKEDPQRAPERRGRTSKARSAQPLVWCHAASVGESQSLLVLVNRLLADYPDIQIMVTTGTVTSAKLMSERLPAGAFHQYMPVDHPDWTENFLTHWHPDLVIWAESEFWPNMLAGIRRRGIPAVLLNARMSEKSFRYWQLAREMIGDMLKTFALCLGQNEAEVNRLLQLGAPAARVSANLKYAAAPLPYDAADLEILKKAVGARSALLWASTHPGEEEVACRVHHALEKTVPDLLTIIVPRHPQRGISIHALTDRAGLRAGLRSQRKLPQKNEPVYIADTLGELGLFYRLCRLCIVGGSFVPIGGHNPIEPAQLGCQIFYGPHMFNFISICHDFESRGAALRVTDEKALVEKIAPALKDPAHFAAMSTAAANWTREQSHIVDDVAALLAPFMKQVSSAKQAVRA